jgi:pimeloyl-ACP methyl ester carboxylesterase
MTMSVAALPVTRSVIHGGVEIHHAEAGQGQPLVFVHGGFGDWRSWSPQWDAFQPHFRCITYSRRFSVPNRNEATAASYSARDEADDLDALLDVWRAAPAILVGTSYGAYTALALALRKPQKVRALVLAEPPLMQWAERLPGGRETREAFEGQVVAPAKAMFERGDTIGAVLRLNNGINGATPGSANTAAGLAARLENARAMQLLLNCSDPFPQIDEGQVRRFDRPTLLLAGATTQAIHDTIFRALCDVMTQAEQVRIPACGHGAHRDNPQAFNGTALAFLRRHGFGRDLLAVPGITRSARDDV